MKSFVKFLINIFIGKIFYHAKYFNQENEKKLDRCIICPNHSSFMDPTWIYAKTKNLCIMAKSELFEPKWFGKILSYLDVFPIHRGKHDARSLLHAIKIFENQKKRKLLVFVEGGTVKGNKERGDAKVGPAYIAYKTNTPIVPVYITKNPKKFKRVNIIYGKAQYITEEIAKDKQKLQEFSDNLLDSIYNLRDVIQ